MKSKSILFLVVTLLLAWVFLFQGTQSASSSPLMRITFTPTPTQVPTLPPPPIITNPPLIPVTGTDKTGSVDWLFVGGVALLVVGVAGLAMPQKRKS